MGRGALLDVALLLLLMATQGLSNVGVGVSCALLMGSERACGFVRESQEQGTSETMKKVGSGQGGEMRTSQRMMKLTKVCLVVCRAACNLLIKLWLDKPYYDFLLRGLMHSW